ncbi:hypothetical protein BH23ACI1_BH23ACI1_28160 [soil metagenome]
MAGPIRSGRVIEVFTQLARVLVAPRSLHSYDGPEFVARAVLHWLAQAQAESAFIDPGKLWQNGAGESFHGKLRDEYLTLQCASTGSETRLRLHSRLSER